VRVSTGLPLLISIPDTVEPPAEIVLHQPTGVLYLACSTPESRVHWTPAVLRLNASGRSSDDYIATYNPHTSRITKYLISGSNARGLSLHGMDVVPSAANASELWVYLINHRLPLEGDASVVGADSSIEVFKTAVGSDTLAHVRTFEHPVIITPNDVVGSADGQSVYFTNDYSVKTGNVSQTAFPINPRQVIWVAAKSHR
jgi:arylesterase / paraoxonase